MATFAIKDITPMDGYVVVEQLEAPEKTDSGIYLPGNADNDQQVGTVVAVSKSVTTEHGQEISCPVKKGDHILFKSSFSSDMELKVDGRSVHLLKYSSIVAKVNI